jgi:hypothetical protein
LLLALNSLFQSGLPFGMSENNLVIIHIHNVLASCSPFSALLAEPLAEKSEVRRQKAPLASYSDFCLLPSDCLSILAPQVYR